jgi:hypothetical protein
MVKHLSTTIEEDQYYCKVQPNDTIKIHVSTPESYWRLVKQLQDDKIIYHTYHLIQERAYRIVIRNLHYSTPTAQITTNLEKQGHKVRNILLNIVQQRTTPPIFYRPRTKGKQQNHPWHGIPMQHENYRRSTKTKETHRTMHKMPILWTYQNLLYKTICMCQMRRKPQHIHVHKTTRHTSYMCTLWRKPPCKLQRMWGVQKTYKKSGASHSTKLPTDLSSKKSALTIRAIEHFIFIWLSI